MSEVRRILPGCPEVLKPGDLCMIDECGNIVRVSEFDIQQLITANDRARNAEEKLAKARQAFIDLEDHLRRIIGEFDKSSITKRKIRQAIARIDEPTPEMQL
jgi:hypothetical protein